MRSVAIGFATILLVASSASIADHQGRVVHIVDGDTLDVALHKGRVRVRIVDIDAPEDRQPYGHRSRQSLIAICSGEPADLDVKGKDRNGRVLARVTCNGTDAGAEQVRRGMAWVFERYAPTDSPLYAAQLEARVARRGLWSAAAPVPPWEWRSQSRTQPRE